MKNLMGRLSLHFITLLLLITVLLIPLSSAFASESSPPPDEYPIDDSGTLDEIPVDTIPIIWDNLTPIEEGIYFTPD
jgi:hypothetical protein